MRKFAMFCFVAWPLALAGPISGQNAEEPPTYLLVLGFADGPEIGIWRQWDAGRQIGIDLEVHGNFTSVNSLRAVTAIVTPGLKRFLGSPERLRSYLYGGVPLSFVRGTQTYDPGTGDIEVDQWQWGAGLITGIGVDARILDGLEVGGHVGVRGTYLKSGRADNGAVAEDEDRWIAGIHTYTSGVRVQLHF